MRASTESNHYEYVRHFYRRPRGTPTEATKTTKVQSTQRTQLRVQRGLAAGERDGGLVVVGAARARHAQHLAPAAQRGPQQVLVPRELGE